MMANFMGDFGLNDMDFDMSYLSLTPPPEVDDEPNENEPEEEVDTDREFNAKLNLAQLQNELRARIAKLRKSKGIKRFYCRNLQYAQFVEKDMKGNKVRCYDPPKHVYQDTNYKHPIPNITSKRLELIEAEQISFFKFVKESIIIRRKYKIASRFDQLGYDAGLTTLDLETLNRTCFDPVDPEVIRDFLDKKWSLKDGWDGVMKIIRPVIHIQYNQSGGIDAIVRMETDLNRLFHWRISAEKELNSLMQGQLFNDPSVDEDIDWEYVSKQMLNELNQDYSARQCEIIWNGYLSPRVHLPSNWTKQDYKKLVNLTKTSLDKGFVQIAKEMGEGYNPLICLNIYLKNIKPALKNLEPPEETLESLWDWYIEYYFSRVMKKSGGDFEYASMALSNAFNTQFPIEFLEEMWNKMRSFRCNSKFHPLEDAILLATIEKLKSETSNEFRDLIDVELPWRDSFTWIQRLDKLMFKFHYSRKMESWTIDEDEKLLSLVGRYNRKWRKIEEHFVSPPRRVDQLLTRYAVLMMRLAKESLVEYHGRNDNKSHVAKVRYRHMKTAHFILKKVADRVDIPGYSFYIEDVNSNESKNMCYEMPQTHPPNEFDFINFLRQIDVKYIQRALIRVQNFLESKNESPCSGDWIYLESILKSDRRVFNRSDPRSVASAIHLRHIQLKTGEELQGSKLSPFQQSVLNFYSNFFKLGTKRQKQNIMNHIPKTEYLLTLPELQGILKSRKSVLNAMRKIKRERRSNFLTCLPELPITKRERDLEYILPDLEEYNNNSFACGKHEGTDFINPTPGEEVHTSPSKISLASFGRGKKTTRLSRLRSEVSAKRWEAQKSKKKLNLLEDTKDTILGGFGTYETGAGKVGENSKTIDLPVRAVKLKTSVKQKSEVKKDTKKSRISKMRSEASAKRWEAERLKKKLNLLEIQETNDTILAGFETDGTGTIGKSSKTIDIPVPDLKPSINQELEAKTSFVYSCSNNTTTIVLLTPGNGEENNSKAKEEPTEVLTSISGIDGNNPVVKQESEVKTILAYSCPNNTATMIPPTLGNGEENYTKAKDEPTEVLTSIKAVDGNSSVVKQESEVKTILAYSCPNNTVTMIPPTLGNGEENYTTAKDEPTEVLTSIKEVDGNSSVVKQESEVKTILAYSCPNNIATMIPPTLGNGEENYTKTKDEPTEVLTSIKAVDGNSSVVNKLSETKEEIVDPEMETRLSLTTIFGPNDKLYPLKISLNVQNPKPGENFWRPIIFKDKAYLPVSVVKEDVSGTLKFAFTCSDVSKS